MTSQYSDNHRANAVFSVNQGHNLIRIVQLAHNHDINLSIVQSAQSMIAEFWLAIAMI